MAQTQSTQPITPLTACYQWLDKAVDIAPLAVFRILFGLLMLGSTTRFWYLGWIEDHFLNAQVTFKYFGFEWVSVLPPWGMYAIHGVMLASALGIALGFKYRWSALLFFLSFTYVELIDLTYYLNHYYFVSLVAFLLIFTPANRHFSLDVFFNPNLHAETTPRWSIVCFQALLGIVYTYAGLAKINADWLLHALPLKIWLPANDYWPLIGGIFKWKITAYVFSWVGMLYDATIVGWLVFSKTRAWAYASVVIFHVLTGILFQIGVFPLVMMAATWIFFSPTFHRRVLFFLGKRLDILRGYLKIGTMTQRQTHAPATPTPRTNPWFIAFLGGFFLFQLLFPWRYVFYPNHLFWSEEGYRFGWRVMLMEKAGTATFYVKDGVTGREGMVNNADFLCAHQEKQMAMQPDLILQFAHFLRQHYAARGVSNPSVRAEVYVTLNGRPSRLLIDPNVDLTKINDGWQPKNWILPYEN